MSDPDLSGAPPANVRLLEWVVLCIVGLATAAYCLFVGLLSASWACSGADPGAASLLSRLFLKPLFPSVAFGMLHWQLPVVLSMGLAVRRLLWAHEHRGVMLHLVAQIGWLLTAGFLHAAAFLVGTVPLCAAIG